MDDFPNEDDEFEMMHAAEMEMMREMEEEMGHQEPLDEVFPVPSQAKRKLQLGSAHSPSGVTATSGTGSLCSSSSTNRQIPSMDVIGGLTDVLSSSLEMPSNSLPIPSGLRGSGGGGVKRPLPPQDLDLESIDDMWDDPPPQKQSKRRRPLVPEVRGCDDLLTGRRRDPTEPDPDLAIIERIKQHRQQTEQLRAGGDKNMLAASARADTRRSAQRCVIHRRIPQGGFQALTSVEGQRVYLSMADDVLSGDEEEEGDIFSAQPPSLPAATAALVPEARRKRTRQLLSQPFEQIKEAAHAELMRQALRVSRAADGVDSGVESGVEEDEVDKAALWTDVYRPSHYLHLLSDEMTNRTVLYWIKMWDKFVFGVDRRQRRNRDQQQQKNQENWKDGGGKFSKFDTGQKVLKELRDEVEADGRPVQKVVLLCGPPGLGKTTLAHIIARHAGYNVVELNASDDRSVEAFRSSIENATSMRSVLDKERRPNCLVIDEIDGAPAPSIKLLVNLITGKGLGGKAPTKKGSKQKTFVLQRPVIAICNDAYGPALRPLRQLALVVTFPPTLSYKLAQRLHEICGERGLRTDLTALMALAHKTHNDIRSCLALLQFVRDKRGSLKLTDIDGAAVGQKDYQQSLFAVWNNIFSIPRPVKARRINPHDLPEPVTALTTIREGRPAPVLSKPSTSHTGVGPSPLSERYREVLQAAMSCSEYDKILLGWFENYPTSKFKHTHLEPVTHGLEWAEFLDVMSREVHTSQSWSLQGYLPHVFVALHLRFASHQRSKVVFPTQHNEQVTKLQRSETLVSSLLQSMSPGHRVFVGPRLLVTDLLPYLLTIVQPHFRPVNTQLYSTKEKADLYSVINTMLAYNLTYSQERTPEGQYSFVLEPNVEEVVKFSGESSGPQRKQLSYTAKQLVAREVEMERVRRAESYFSEQEQQKKINPKREALFAKLNAAAASSSKANKENEPASANAVDNASSSSSTDSSSSSSTKSSSLQSASKVSHSVVLTPVDPNQAEDVIPSSQDDPNVPNHLRKLVAKPVIKAPTSKLPRDFFGRVIHLTAAQQEKAAAVTNDIVKSDIWFRFKEGYSNAVRRPIKLKDLC